MRTAVVKKGEEVGRGAGLSGVISNDAAGGRGSQTPLPPEARAADAAVDPSAGTLGAVRLRRGARGRGKPGGVVVRVAGVVAVSGGAVADKTLSSVAIGLDRTLRLLGA